jgi:hypothetical protein
MRVRHLIALAGALLAWEAGAQAATYRLDDSASQVIPPNAQWEWASGSLRTGTNTVHLNARVIVRIDTRQWAGRAGRIYMVLPVDAGGRVTAQWDSEGRLIPGRMLSGERTLVFSGTVPGPVLEDRLTVRLSADARTLVSDTQRFAFHFELDTP